MVWENFENCEHTIEKFIIFIFENVLLKIEPSENNTIFLQQFFWFRGWGDFHPPVYALVRSNLIRFSANELNPVKMYWSLFTQFDYIKDHIFRWVLHFFQFAWGTRNAWLIQNDGWEFSFHKHGFPYTENWNNLKFFIRLTCIIYYFVVLLFNTLNYIFLRYCRQISIDNCSRFLQGWILHICLNWRARGIWGGAPERGLYPAPHPGRPLPYRDRTPSKSKILLRNRNFGAKLENFLKISSLRRNCVLAQTRKYLCWFS